MSMESNFPPPYTDPQVSKDYEGGTAQVRRLGHTSCDYRRSHIEAWIKPLTGGQSKLNIPIIADAQGTIRGIRVRSKSKKIKFTLTSSPCYKVGASIHPRSIVYQATTEECDTIYDFENLYVFQSDNNTDIIKLYLSVENQGADSDGVSVIITFGY